MLWFFLLLTLFVSSEQPPSFEIDPSTVSAEEQPIDVGPCGGGSDWFDENPAR